ncbi:hypothetical protein BDV23DRAFT_183949 [Aspergillus alliaceus]|uniref:Zn(2)-C6 fungal-type domain-containing protein n=1 Tax=Petromyces alliaceus TaxID=209559 RepID=A0A5N7C6X9_PETAA|nr:hypothetical protein BDV23DRAFT_183949 [Aspergillus alliaceus]
MNNTNGTPPATTASLRTSCDRCRAQKLRCVPSSKTDPFASCQRCLRAKGPKSCVFSRRLRTGRQTKTTGESDHRQVVPRRERVASTASLPGMSAFALSSLTSPKEPTFVESHQPMIASPRELKPDGRDTDMSINCVSVAFMESPWDHDIALDPALQHQIDTFPIIDPSISPADEPYVRSLGENMDSHIKTSFHPDFATFLDIQNILTSPPYTASPNIGPDIDMDAELLAEEKPSPLVNLSALLAKMSHYETQLARLYDSKLDSYPIGDALFLSQHFYAILADSGQLDASSDLDMPTRLLTLSCYIMLTRIYFAIFTYLHEHLSRLPDARCSTHRLARSSDPSVADMHAYRGLRLGQLQPMCVCTGWEPAMRIKKAVSMLLDSLGNAERALVLPPTVGVLHTPGAQGITGDKMPLFEEGVMAGLTNGRLQKKLREQERELRGKVEEVDDLLDGLLVPST